jgi:hypothetical protein
MSTPKSATGPKTISASKLAQSPSVRSLPQCLSLAAGSFIVTALAGDTLKIQSAVVQLGALSSQTPTILSAVASLEHQLPAQPVVHLKSRGELQAGGSVETVIAYIAATYSAADLNADMVVCYWVDTFQHSGAGLQSIQSRTPAQCLTGHAGIFTITSSTTGSSQISAAIAKRGAAVINTSTLLSEIASLVLQSSSHSEDLPLCRGSEHINGYWKPTQAQNKSFICCESDDDDHTARSKYCGHIQHRRIFNLTALDGNHRDAPFYMHAGEHSCICDAGQGRLSVSKRESYIWTPHSCRISDWGAHSFCRHLGSRSMVFIGDSTMYQTAVTVTNVLVAANATCIQQISYALSDTLVGKELGLFNRGKSMSEIVQTLQDTNSSIIVLSAGAHVFEGFESLVAEVAQIIQQIRSSASGLPFVWRTQQPGHRLCGLATAPSQYIQEVSHIYSHIYNHPMLQSSAS